MDGLSGRLGAPHSPWISRWSRHSRRSVPAYRSAKEFARGDRTGDLMIRTLLPANTSSNVLVNLPSPVTDQESEAVSACAQVHQEVPGLLGGPGPSGVGRDAQDARAGFRSP